MTTWRAASARVRALRDGFGQEPRRGGVVVVVGPDGSGKSTLADNLSSSAPSGLLLMRMHHRPGLLPALGGGGPTTTPHAARPYPSPLSEAKTLYLFLDYVLGWVLRVRPHVRRGGWVILERGWWDIVVDPIRYRIRPPARLARYLGRVLWKPARVIVLEGSAGLLRSRKAELPVAELARQREAWRGLHRGDGRWLFIHAELPPADQLRAALRSLGWDRET
jgi:hypothetical protein